MPKDERLPAPAPGLSGINRTIRARSPATETSAASGRGATSGSGAGTAFDADLDADLDELLAGDLRGATAFGLGSKDVEAAGPASRGASTRFGVQALDSDDDGAEDWHAVPSGFQARTQLGLDRHSPDSLQAPNDVRELIRDLPESWENDVSMFLREHSAPSGVRVATIPDERPIAFAGDVPSATHVPLDKGQATQYGVAASAILRKKRPVGTGSSPAASKPASAAALRTPAAAVAPVAAAPTPPPEPALAARMFRSDSSSGRPAPQSATPTLNVVPEAPPRLGGPATQSLDMRPSARRDTQPIDLRTADARFANVALQDDTPPQPVVAPREPKTVADEDLPFAVQQAMRDARSTATALDAVATPTTSATPAVRPTQVAGDRAERDYGEASFSATLNIQDVDFDAIRNAPLDQLASPTSAPPQPPRGATHLFSDDVVAFTRPVEVHGPASVVPTGVIFDAPAPPPPRMSPSPDATAAEPAKDGDRLDFSEIAFADTMRPAPVQPPQASPAFAPAAFAARLRASGDSAAAADPVDLVTLSPNGPVDTVRMPDISAMAQRQQVSGRQAPERPMRNVNAAITAPPHHKTSAEWLSTNKMVVVIAVVALVVALLTIVTLARG